MERKPSWSKDMSPEDREAYNAYMREYMKARYYRRRAKWLERLGNVCIELDHECGGDLEFDHSDRASKSFDLGKALAGWSETRIAAEMVKCVLRCETHHKRKSAQEMSVEHGGGVSGKKNCPCSLCKEKRAEYMREYKRKQRL